MPTATAAVAIPARDALAERAERARALRAENNSWASIGRVLGVSQQTARRDALGLHAVKKPPRRIECAGYAGQPCPHGSWWYSDGPGRPRKYCATCLVRRRWVEAEHRTTCLICGSPIEQPTRGGRPRVTCDARECKTKAAHRERPPRPEVICCAACRRDFKPHDKGPLPRTCSPACSAADLAQRRREDAGQLPLLHVRPEPKPQDRNPYLDFFAR